MSPSYSGKLLMIALRDSSTILYKYAHTLTSVCCAFVRYLWANVRTNTETLSSTSFCSHIRVVQKRPRPSAPETRWISARFRSVAEGNTPTARHSDLLNYLTIFSLRLFADPSFPSSYIWLRSRAITGICIRFPELSLLDIAKGRSTKI